MGRIRTTFVKALGVKVYNKHKDKFTNDFQKNKKSLEEVAEFNSKKLKNVVAGYITKLFKTEESKNK